ncbi:hypothetical protein BKA62DRAFT_322713 [Auriculariales sp. MPI-PUGE-AT-0066]|nr:hypothetical protein BKA62DRAFT_322713 [Auriculariales sp. MPI-PUGE-AT-0066]
MNRSQASQVVLVTGASEGTGLNLVDILLQRGHRIASFSQTLSAELKAFQNSNPNFLLTIQGDPASHESCASAIAFTTSHFGRLDALVLSGASDKPSLHGGDIREEEIAENFAANLSGAYSLLRAAIPELRGPRGRVVIMTTALSPGRGSIAEHGATAAAVDTLVSSIAQEEESVTFLALDPGLVNTPFRKRVAQTTPSATHNEAANVESSNMLVSPKQVASNIAALALHAPEGMSGRIIKWDADEVKALLLASA